MMDNMWTWKDPRILRCWSRFATLFWKAILMRKRSLIVSSLEILIPIIFALQIRLIFEPLALHIQDVDLHTREDILSSIPRETNYHYAPRNDFFDNLMKRVSSMIQRPISSAVDEKELVTQFYAKSKKKRHENTLWVIFQRNNSEDTSQPEILNYKIRTRMSDAMENVVDPYMSSGFLAMQIAVESAFIDIWRSVTPSFTGKKMTLGRFPYYRIHFPMLPSTVRPNISLIYYLTIVGFLLIPTATLHKVIHDKATGFKALMRMLRIQPRLMYLGWIDYIMITALPATIISTWILSPVYSNSGAIVLGIFFIMYITMSAMIILAAGTFFTHSIKAVLACLLFWVFLAHLTIVLDESLIDSGLLIKSATLFLPHSGLLYGLAALTSRPDINDFRVEKSLTLDLDIRRMEIADEKNKVTIGLVFLFWTLHIVAWYNIAIYLENIYPGKFGTRKSWYYPCKSQSKPSDIFVSFRGSTNWSAVERGPKFTQAKVRVRRVTINYGIAEKLEVLRDMSIDFYLNEFSAILGHNGAGKSSLLKIMTGMYKATYGRVYIEGRDYTNEEWSEYQQESFISYCPQENILVNYLSTFEHVHLFGMMKGMSFNEAKRESQKLLEELGLMSEMDFMVNKLTFGGKRRLCLAMALIGPSEVLILDEPAYGIDPQYRKKIWKLLSSFKGKKTIIMATNAMEAADNLADRIAIIANGRIECYGSKAYLNRRYGIGHELKLIMNPGSNFENLQQLIQEYSPMPIIFRGTMGSIVKFNVHRSTRFPRLLSFLKAKKEELNIKSFSLSPPSIEGQFISFRDIHRIMNTSFCKFFPLPFHSTELLRIGLASRFKGRGVSFPMTKYELMDQQRRREIINSGKKWVKITNAALCRQQLIAMLYKKMLHVTISWKLYLFSIIFSIMTMILTITFAELSKNPRFNALEINLNATRYTERNFFMLYHSSSDHHAQEFFSSVQSVTRIYSENFDVSKNVTSTEIMLHPNLHSIHLRDRYFMSLDILKKNQIRIMYSPVAIHAAPIALNLFHNSLLRHSTNNENLRINLKSQPLINPRDWQYKIVHQKSVKNWENSVIIISLFLVLPTVELVIIEAKSLTKLLQLNTHGITPFIYWLPIYSIDLIIYLFSILIIASISSTINNSIPIADMGEVFLILLAYGSAAMSMGYCIQIIVNRRGTVYITIMSINFFAILATNPTIMFPVATQWLAEPVRILIEIILHGIPPYVLACTIGNYIGINLYNNQCLVENNCGDEFGIEDPCCQNCGDRICHVLLNKLLDSQSGSMFFHSVASDVLIMFFQAFCFNLILFLYESRKYKQIETRNNQRSSPGINDGENYGNKETDGEIFIDNSRKELQANDALTSETAVAVENLSQKYGKKEIIHDINFKINSGECYALLGMNGTGKTTLIRVLTGQIASNKGKAVIYGVDLSRNPNKFLEMIGYCPQNNGLLEFLTGRQNLRFFAAIRGIPRKFINDEIDKWLDVFDLLDFENVEITNCAWGIKRKICLLQSIIGNSQVIFLDEPGSGMDVIARNALVDTLYQVKETGITLCLTTHSTDEAEAVCDYLGILVGGRLIKTGSPEEIKGSFGEKICMRIIFNRETTDETIEIIKNSVQQIFPSANFVERFLNGLDYEFEDAISYNEVYNGLDILKHQNSSIIDYFVNQQSLEQVFHKLSQTEAQLTIKKSIVRRIIIHLEKFFRKK